MPAMPCHNVNFCPYGHRLSHLGKRQGQAHALPALFQLESKLA